MRRSSSAVRNMAVTFRRSLLVCLLTAGLTIIAGPSPQGDTVSAASPGTSDRHHELRGPGSHSAPEWIAYKDHQLNDLLVRLRLRGR